MLGPSSHRDRNTKNLQVPIPPPPSIHIRHLLLTAAQLVSRSDLPAAHRLISTLSSNSSAFGDSSQRLIYSFTKALTLRLHINPPTTTATNSFIMTQRCNIYNNQYDDDDPVLQSSYLSLNKITPFVRFSHFTANQAILEAIHQESHHHHHHHHHHYHSGSQYIHIIDFNIMNGIQWPPLMQTIADRYPQPTLRLTAAGKSLNILRKTGDRLSKFAHSLGLRFSFHPLLLPNINNETLTVNRLIDHLSTVLLLPNETLVVNCVLYLHRHLKSRDNLFLLLRKIKSMNPRVVTLSEQEAYHNHPMFLSRFTEAVNYYTAVFESLEATLPPFSRERIAVEQGWFGREIADIVAEEGDCRKERHERFRSWEVMMVRAGFSKVPLSRYALSQARLLLRLHYPCEGYNLEVIDDVFFLGWQTQSLFSLSSWH